MSVLRNKVGNGLPIGGMVLLGALLMALPAASASAQEQTLLEAHIPFQFSVNGVTLPAGEYTLSQLDTAAQSVLRLASPNGRHIVLMAAQTDQPKPALQSELVFDQVGGQHVLAELWVQGRETGFRVPGTELAHH